ncbi:MAG: hypothetical protein M1830_008926 [Pleopsidium flavum]|nr:MAG: hypothetical protein M1830_008926 [Pleopsidium flavum]
MKLDTSQKVTKKINTLSLSENTSVRNALINGTEQIERRRRQAEETVDAQIGAGDVKERVDKAKPNKAVPNKRKLTGNAIDALSYAPKQQKQQYGSSAGSSRSNSIVTGRHGQQPGYIESEDDDGEEDSWERSDNQLKPLSKLESGMQASSSPPTFRPITTADLIRAAFLRHLETIPGPSVKLINTIDDSSPPLGYGFIEDYKLGTGVSKAGDDFMSGCECKPNNGRNVGCEYTKCGCLSEAEPGPNDKQVFPYWCQGPRNGCLRDFYLESRHTIFECNKFCRCPANCKNRNVQHGRKIQLEIFKTANRGWGLRCPQPLRKGQFVDTYRGEVITSKEADKREEESKGKDSYLFTLDKFAAGHGIADEDLYVVDGEHMGGPTRFMNHSCEPNCRQFTVSYNNGDPKVYDLAFFAIHDIPANTELTFDYLGIEVTEDTKNRKPEKGTPRCLCGAENCRKYLWR